MSVLGSLFGSLRTKKFESSVSNLFKNSSGPVDALEVKSRQRTVLPEIVPSKVVESSGSDGESSGGEVSESSDAENEEFAPAVEEQEKEEEEKSEQPTTKPKRKRVYDDDDEEDLEEAYYSKLLKSEESKDANNQAEIEKKEETDDEADEKQKPSHIKEASVARVSAVNLKEAELEKAERTVFVGNVPFSILKDKKVYAEFKRLVSQHPKVSADEDEADSDDEATDFKIFAVESIRFRSIAFEEPLPRKVAFIQQKLHKSRDSLNAYVVFKDKKSAHAACKLNGAVFHDHHLRFDSVAHPAPYDNKRSVFVGNLDFEETEENLWRHFESCGDIEYVRIIRDSKTNFGKGFAFVQFVDLISVNKALLLNDKKMTTGKGRKIRVTRCKNIRKMHSSGQKLPNLTDKQRTKIGKAKKILGKADRVAIAKQLTIEGLRASKGDNIPTLKRKKPRSKTGRVTKRSQAFKKNAKDISAKSKRK